jgi:hypothetical protein
MAASVWMKFSKVLMPSWLRPSALTMPLVTVCPTPNGLPIASTWSPTCSASELPSVITGSRSRLIFRMARSVSGSVPITFARVLRLSFSATSISVAPSTTWLLVRMKPSWLMMTPLPRPLCGIEPWSPKKKRNHGSLAEGRSPALLVLMLTTAWEALCAAPRKLPTGGGAPTGVGASFREIPLDVAVVTGRLLSHSGFIVMTTK